MDPTCVKWTFKETTLACWAIWQPILCWTKPEMLTPWPKSSVKQLENGNTNTICNAVFYLWNDNHLAPSQRTTPDVIRSSAKYWVSIPSSSCFLNWIPDVVSSSIESWAYMSSLAGEKKDNIQKCHISNYVSPTDIYNYSARNIKREWAWVHLFQHFIYTEGKCDWNTKVNLILEEKIIQQIIIWNSPMVRF